MSQFIQSLDDRVCVMWPQNVGTSPSCVVTHRLGAVGHWLLGQEQLLGQAGARLQLMLLGCTGTATGLSWSAVGAG